MTLPHGEKKNRAKYNATFVLPNASNVLPIMATDKATTETFLTPNISTNIDPASPNIKSTIPFTPSSAPALVSPIPNSLVM